MTIVASCADGRAVEWDEATRQFSVAGQRVSPEDVSAWDASRQLAWPNGEMRAWALSVAASLAASPQPSSHASQNTGPQRRRLGLWIAAGAAVAMLIVWVVMSSASASRQSQAAAEADYLVRGLRIANQSSVLSGIVVSLASSPFGKPHVSVGRAADFPDEVLITVVWPQAMAYQVLVNPNQPPSTPDDVVPKEISPTSLPSNVTQWNATTDSKGHILLDGYEQASMPSK